MRRRATDMANFLLIKSDEILSNQLAFYLTRKRHSIEISNSRPEGLTKFRELASALDMVILDMTAQESEQGAVGQLSATLAILDKIVVLKAECAAYAMILCLLNDYKGPQMELEIERRGAAVVYVR